MEEKSIESVEYTSESLLNKQVNQDHVVIILEEMSHMWIWTRNEEILSRCALAGPNYQSFFFFLRNQTNSPKLTSGRIELRS